MEFRLLGSLQVSDQDRALPLGGPKQRVVLVHLVLRPDQVVSSNRLIDEVWGDDPPPAARSTLQGYVSHLRKALGARRLEGRAGGYVLHVDPSEVDALRFEALVERARREAATDPAAAATTFQEALALWRGGALDDLADQPSLRTEVARLEELRMAATEGLIAAALDLGRHAELIPELETLTAAHPLRERLWAHLMTALYRSGRQGDALAAYQRARELLAEELGVDPSPELQRLQGQILRQDPALEVAGEPLRGYRLLEEVGAGSFGSVHRAYQPQVGREVAVKVIHSRFADDPEFIRRFEAEAQLVARLEHPYIVPLYDFWREPNGAYLVMRYLRGGSLRERLAEGPLPPEETAGALEQVAGALQVAHRQGVIHRDVKPANVLFDEEQNAYLTDFGIAKDLAAAEAAAPGGASSPVAYYLTPEEIRGDPATPATDVYGLGVLLHEALAGRHPFADTAPEEVIHKHLREPLPSIRAVRPELPAGIEDVISRATAKDPKARYDGAGELAAAFRETLAPAVAEPVPLAHVEARNPYKGLRSFAEPDAEDFFGREALVERLVARMGETGPGSRFLAVVGPSGSGKSSVVRAGLIPALKGGALPGSDRWFVVDMTPGAHPFEELETSLTRIAVDPHADLGEGLERGDLGVLRATARSLPDERATLLLVIDQFEEVFARVADEGERARFLAALHAAVTAPNSPLRLVLTLRADFYDRPLLYRDFGELVRRSLETVVPLSPEELVAAITEPAEARGVELEEGLVAEIVTDVMDQPGALPLLQYALTELFERRVDGVLTRDAYGVIGGVRGALGRRAEELWGRLDPDGQEAARQLFLRLVTLGEGVEDTRRRVQQAEVLSIEGARGRVRQVMDLFGEHRLLSFDHDPLTRDPTVELAHEALIREWERLQGWIDAAREDLQIHRRVAAAAEEWAAAGRDPSLLLRGSYLDRVGAWTRTSGLSLTDAERTFVEASADAREAERATEEHRRAHEARLERSAVNRLRALVAVLGVALFLATALSLFAFQQRDRAREQNLESRARELVLFSAGSLESDPDLSLLLALEAARLTASDRGIVLPETRDALHWALQAKRVVFPPDAPVAVRQAPSGPRGVFDVPIEDLLVLARDHASRSLTAEECRRYLGTERCPPVLESAALGSLRPAPDEDHPGEGTGDKALAGTQVRLLTTTLDPEEVGPFQAALASFERDTGVTVISSSLPIEDPRLTTGLEADVLMLGQPSLFAELGRAGELLDIGRYLDLERIRQDYAPYLLRLVTIGEDGRWPSDSGRMLGGWVKLNPKSLIWYPPSAFEEAGYDIPETWDELIDLSERMVDEGRTPWCLGIESGESSGWLGTDWIEDLLLRTAGPDEYDAWVARELRFDDPPVRRAFELFGRVAFTPGYILGGPEAIARTSFSLAQEPMFEDPPRCWLHRQASFAPAFFPPGIVPVDDVATFPFPAIDPAMPPAMMGGGDIFGVRTDRPEVRELAAFLVSPEYGEEWAAMRGGGFISPNLRFDLQTYANPLTRAHAEEVLAALKADAFRFDASDLMPPEVGSEAFFNGMIEYVERGPDSLDEVLWSIDAAWPR